MVGVPAFFYYFYLIAIGAYRYMDALTDITIKGIKCLDTVAVLIKNSTAAL